MKPTEFQRHIIATYINIRIGAAALAIILPLVLWAGGRLLFDLPLQASMSAYYHAADGAMRDVFVGVLIAVGAFLYLYKGYTNLENTALNLAGLLLVGVALFPMDWNCGNACGGLSLHGTFAILFFLSIAYVCVFRASDTLDLIEDETKVKRYKSIYRWLGVGMIASPAIALALSWFFQLGSETRSWVFFVEAVGVVVFGSFWITKSTEIALTNSEQRALDGKLSTPQLQVADVLRPISVDQVEAHER